MTRVGNKINHEFVIHADSKQTNIISIINFIIIMTQKYDQRPIISFTNADR